jgi:hypothetical protein
MPLERNGTGELQNGTATCSIVIMILGTCNEQHTTPTFNPQNLNFSLTGKNEWRITNLY